MQPPDGLPIGKEMTYHLALGSNHRRTENLALARRRLAELFPGIRFSAERETEPLFFRSTAKFSNQVASFSSPLPPAEVKLRLKAIEREAGRLPGEKEREIVRLDIDLLACGGTVFKPLDLEREYVVRGMEELAEQEE